jgi:hypothetical protein
MCVSVLEGEVKTVQSIETDGEGAECGKFGGEAAC